MAFTSIRTFLKLAVLYWTALALVNYAVQYVVQLLLFMKASLHSIKLKH